MLIFLMKTNQVLYLITFIMLKGHWFKYNQYQESTTFSEVINVKMEIIFKFYRIFEHQTMRIIYLLPSYGNITPGVGLPLHNKY